MSSVTLTVGGTDVTSHLAVGTLRVREKVDARSSLSATFRFDGTPSVRLGQRITLKTADRGAYGTGAYGADFYSDRDIFAGIVDSVSERVDDADRTVVNATASDLTSLLDRYLVAASYRDVTAGAIVRDIITNSGASAIAGESLGVSGVEDGPTVVASVFNYQRVSDALDQLATYAGFLWRVTPAGIVEFRDRAGQAAPFTITEASRNYRALTVKRDPGDYRNAQYLRAGKELTASRTESFPGDSTRTYVLAYPVGKVPTITVNGASKAVGIRGLDAGKDWYWQKEDAVISQDDGATPLSSGDTLAVTYQGLYPIIVQTSNRAEQSARASAEGTAGIYEHVTQDASIDDGEVATLRAEALLARFGSFEASIRFDTDEVVEASLLDVRVGHLITITKPAHRLNDSCLLESLDWSLGSDDRWRLTASALTGSQTVSWLRYWRALSQQQQGLAIRENEVVIIGGSASTFADTSTLSDSLTSGSAAPESRVGYAQVGYSEVG